MRVRLQKSSGSGKSTAKLRIRAGTHNAPRIQPLQERYFALIDIPDSRHRTLIEQRVPELLGIAFAQPPQGFIGIKTSGSAGRDPAWSALQTDAAEHPTKIQRQEC